MFGLGPMELIIIFLVILLLFGAKRIPEIAQGIGKGINEFKRAARDVTDEIDTSVKAEPPQVKQKNELKEQVKPETKTTSTTTKQS
jgi:sec-independent protein translocase protein TatA